MSSLPDTAVCLHCGYPLRGLPGNVCPECGHSFDQGNPTTYGLPNENWRIKLERRLVELSGPPSLATTVLSIFALGLVIWPLWSSPAYVVYPRGSVDNLRLMLAAPILVVAFLYAAVRFRAVHGCRGAEKGSSPPGSWRFYVAPVCISLAFAAIATDWPLLVRFHLSRPFVLAVAGRAK